MRTRILCALAVCTIAVGSACTPMTPGPEPTTPPPCVQGAVLPGPGLSVTYTASRLSGPIGPGTLLRTYARVGAPPDCTGVPIAAYLLLGEFPFSGEQEYLANLGVALPRCIELATAAGAIPAPNREARVIGQVSGLPPGVIVCAVLDNSTGQVVWPSG